MDHRLSEAEGYYSLLQDQVREMSKSLNSSEEAKQLQETSKAMLEALRQCIDIMKDSQLTDQVLRGEGREREKGRELERERGREREGEREKEGERERERESERVKGVWV